MNFISHLTQAELFSIKNSYGLYKKKSMIPYIFIIFYELFDRNLIWTYLNNWKTKKLNVKKLKLDTKVKLWKPKLKLNTYF